MKIIKRSGSEVEFNRDKIEVAVTKANESVVPSARMTPIQIKRIAAIQTPRVGAGAQPAADDGVLALDDVINVAGIGLVHCRHGMDAPPCVVAGGIPMEVVPGGVGTLRALGGA